MRKPEIYQRPIWPYFPRPAGLWLFNEGAGGKVFDLSGNGNTGTASGLSWSGGNLVFDGANTHCVIVPAAAGSSLDSPGKITLIVKHKPTTVVANYLAGRHQNWLWVFIANGRYYVRINTGFNEHFTDAIVEAGEWSVVAVTFDDSKDLVQVFHNGVFDSQDAAASTYNMVSSSNAWYIGEDPRDGTGAPYSGEMEYVMIFNRALTAQQIAQLYIDPFPWFVEDPVSRLYVPAAGGISMPIVMQQMNQFNGGAAA